MKTSKLILGILVFSLAINCGTVIDPESKTSSIETEAVSSRSLASSYSSDFLRYCLKDSPEFNLGQCFLHIPNGTPFDYNLRIYCDKLSALCHVVKYGYWPVTNKCSSIRGLKTNCPSPQVNDDDPATSIHSLLIDDYETLINHSDNGRVDDGDHWFQSDITGTPVGHLSIESIIVANIQASGGLGINSDGSLAGSIQFDWGDLSVQGTYSPPGTPSLGNLYRGTGQVGLRLTFNW